MKEALSIRIESDRFNHYHYNDVIMGTIASQINSLTIFYSIVYSDADQRKHQSSASLAFVRGIHRGLVNSPHKWPVTRKMFPFDDVIMFTVTPHVCPTATAFSSLNVSYIIKLSFHPSTELVEYTDLKNDNIEQYFTFIWIYFVLFVPTLNYQPSSTFIFFFKYIYTGWTIQSDCSSMGPCYRIKYTYKTWHIYIYTYI